MIRSEGTISERHFQVQEGVTADAGLRVLLVEDDVDIRALFVTSLTVAGYDVLTAGNGEEALALLRQSQTPPNVIIADLHMPVMDGWQFLKALHSDPQLSAVPVIVLTAGDDPSRDAPRPATTLTKPTSIDDLIVAITRVTQTSR